MTKENNKKCKWKSPNGQQYDCKPSQICGDCENNTLQIQKAYELGKSDLETELAKRAEQIEALNKDKDYFSDALDKQIEATYKAIEENNELKTRVENQKFFLERIRAKFNLSEIDRKEIEGYLESEQLTKAKELLERWLRLYNTNTVKGIITDTRQFLKESE